MHHHLHFIIDNHGPTLEAILNEGFLFGTECVKINNQNGSLESEQFWMEVKKAYKTFKETKLKKLMPVQDEIQNNLMEGSSSHSSTEA